MECISEVFLFTVFPFVLLDSVYLPDCVLLCSCFSRCNYQNSQLARIFGPNVTVYYFLSQDSRHPIQTHRQDEEDGGVTDIRSFWANASINKKKNEGVWDTGVVVATQELLYLVQTDVMSVFDYAAIFNLTTTQTHVLYQHLRYWDILRKCCGYQQSIHNRDLLHNRTQRYGESFVLPNYPACHIYNFNEVEEAFFSTQLAAQFKDDLYLVARSIPPHLHPGFCAAEEQNIKDEPPQGWE